MGTVGEGGAGTIDLAPTLKVQSRRDCSVQQEGLQCQVGMWEVTGAGGAEHQCCFHFRSAVAGGAAVPGGGLRWREGGLDLRVD